MTEDFVRNTTEDQRGNAPAAMRSHGDHIASMKNGCFDDGFVHLIASELDSIAGNSLMTSAQLDLV